MNYRLVLLLWITVVGALAETTITTSPQDQELLASLERIQQEDTGYLVAWLIDRNPSLILPKVEEAIRKIPRGKFSKFKRDAIQTLGSKGAEGAAVLFRLVCDLKPFAIKTATGDVDLDLSLEAEFYWKSFSSVKPQDSIPLVRELLKLKALPAGAYRVISYDLFNSGSVDAIELARQWIALMPIAEVPDLFRGLQKLPLNQRRASVEGLVRESLERLQAQRDFAVELEEARVENETARERRDTVVTEVSRSLNARGIRFEELEDSELKLKIASLTRDAAYAARGYALAASVDKMRRGAYRAFLIEAGRVLVLASNRDTAEVVVKDWRQSAPANFRDAYRELEATVASLPGKKN